MFKSTTPAGFIKGMIRRFAPGKLRWIQGPAFKYTKRHKGKICAACLYGNVALGVNSAVSGVSRQAADALNDEAKVRGFMGYVAFNEAPGRKKKEVMEFLHAALKRVSPAK